MGARQATEVYQTCPAATVAGGARCFQEWRWTVPASEAEYEPGKRLELPEDVTVERDRTKAALRT